MPAVSHVTFLCGLTGCVHEVRGGGGEGVKGGVCVLGPEERPHLGCQAFWKDRRGCSWEARWFDELCLFVIMATLGGLFQYAMFSQPCFPHLVSAEKRQSFVVVPDMNLLEGVRRDAFMAVFI